MFGFISLDADDDHTNLTPFDQTGQIRLICGSSMSEQPAQFAAYRPHSAPKPGFWTFLLAIDGEGYRIKQIFGIARVASVMNAIMALMAARSFIGVIPDVWIWLWLALGLGISFYFIYGQIRFDPQRINRVSQGWRHFMVRMSIAITAIWIPIPVGAILWLQGDAYLVAMFMTVVMLAGAVVGFSSLPIAAVTCVITVTLPVLLTSTLRMGPFNSLQASFILLAIVLSIFSIRHSQMVWRMEERGRKNKENHERLAEAHQSIKTLVDTDQMTGLINRATFIRFLDECVRNPPDHPDQQHVCFAIDLDHFKNINDTMGHDAGDAYLRSVAANLKRNFSDKWVVARVGGDEFAMASRTPMTASQANWHGEEASALLAESITFEDTVISGGGSVGSAFFPEHAGGLDDWLKHADHALRIAKSKRRGSFRPFNERDRVKLQKRSRLSDQLCAAIDHGGIRNVYQPQVELGTGRLLGVETLARWTTPDNAVIPPPKFFDLASEVSRVLDLSDVIFRTAISHLKQLSQDGFSVPSFSINLHPAQLHHPERLFPLIEGLAEQMGGAHGVVLEITENSIIGRGAENVPALLQDLSKRGFRISLDDFGTGFASLTHLQTLPISELKLDRSFVQTLETAPEDLAIVRALLMIAAPRALDLVIEGVETDVQRQILMDAGARIGQGYLYSKPLMLDDLKAFLADHGDHSLPISAAR